MCHQLHPRVHILEKDLCLLFLWALQSWLNLWSVMGGIGQEGGGRSLYVAPKRPSRPGHPWWVGRRALRVTHGRGARNCARTYTTSGRGALAAGVLPSWSLRISISDTWTASLLASVSVCWSTFKGSAPIAADENCKWVCSGWHVQGSASCVRRPVVGSGKQDGGPIISHLQH